MATATPTPSPNKRVTWTPSNGVGNYQNFVSPNMPKPNVVRIEQLSPKVRARYLTGSSGNPSLLSGALSAQDALYAGNVPVDVFYGFLHKDSQTVLGVTNGWSPSTNTGIFPQIAGLLQKMPINLKVGTPFAGADVKVTGLVSGGITVVDSLIQQANKLLGLSNKTVGGASIKDFTSVELQGLTVKCAWYLPEQEVIATQELKRLYRMAYPKSLNSPHIGDAIGRLVVNTLSSVMGATTNVLVAATPTSIGKTFAKTIGDAITPTARPSIDYTSDGKSVPDNNPGFFDNILTALYSAQNDIDGFVTTVNPFPVRLSIGHYLDIEPLVINSVRTTFSKEVFINDDGLHLPIFVETEISFLYWMNPSPDQEFLSLFNNELFGRSIASDLSNISGTSQPPPVSK